MKAWQQTLTARWQALAVREQRALRLAAGLLAAALLWGVGLAPAWRSLQGVAAQKERLARSHERMLALQARAQALQAQPRLTPLEGLAALRSLSNTMGQAAALQVQGEQISLTLRQARAQDLAALLAPETGARGAPAQVQVRRESGTGEARWSGVLVYRLPAAHTGTP